MKLMFRREQDVLFKDLTSVLILAMRELSFFLVDDTVLSSGFSMGHTDVLVAK